MSNNNSNSSLPPPTQTTNNNFLSSDSHTQHSLTCSSCIELESQLILRMPYAKLPNGSYKLHPATSTLREILEKAEATKASDDSQIAANDLLKDRLFIELNAETRKGRVKFDDEVFDARLVDLPCIIESLKTVDRKTFFKTADICQMLVCKTRDDPWPPSDEELFKSLKKKKKSITPSNVSDDQLKKYQWPHGITAPLKNVRKKRFRRLTRKKSFDYDEIEKELKQLFKEDYEAVKTEYEVIYLDKDPDEESDGGEGEYATQSMRHSRGAKDVDMDYSSQDEMATNKGGNNSRQSATNNTMLAGSLVRRSTRIRSKDGGSNLSAGDAFDESSSLQPPASLPAAPAQKLSKRRGSSATTRSNENNNTAANNTSELVDSGSNLTGAHLNERSQAGDGSGSSRSSTLQSKSGVGAKSRTNFKNLFVKDVIGDLSSSSDEDNRDDEDENEDDEDEFMNEEGDSDEWTEEKLSSKSNRKNRDSRGTKKPSESGGTKLSLKSSIKQTSSSKSTSKITATSLFGEDFDDDDDKDEDTTSNFDDIATPKPGSTKLARVRENDFAEANEGSQFNIESSTVNATTSTAIKSNTIYSRNYEEEDEDEEEEEETDEEAEQEEDEEKEEEEEEEGEEEMESDNKPAINDEVAKKLNIEYDLSMSSEQDEEEEERSKNDENTELNQKLNQLMNELHVIQEERQSREIQIKGVNNQVLKEHFLSSLNKLIDEENRKSSEIDELKSQLKKSNL